MLGDNGRHERWKHQHMSDVVAVVRHQYSLLARQNDDIADRIFFDFELVHLQRVIDKLAGGSRRSCRINRVWHVAHHVQIAVQLLRELFTGQGTLT